MVILALLTLTGCTAPTPISESRLKLGTNITITAHDTPPRGTFTAVWDRIDEIEKLMSINSSRYTSTEIMEVNQAAGDHAVELSADSMHVLQTGIDIGRLSDGAFDITIAPLVLLWQVTTDDPSLPPEDAIEEARRLVDYTEVQIDGNAVFLPEPGMGIDLGGIAKGYAANEAAQILRENGINHAVLDFGGDIVAVGSKPDGSPWRVGLQDPQQRRGNLMGVVEVSDSSVVTSGIYERFFELDNIRYHHLLDPATGYPTRNELTSVTVITTDPTIADALSTAAFVLGLEDGLQLLEEQEGVEGIFIDHNQLIHLTSGIQNSLRLLTSEYTINCSDCSTENE